MTRISPTMVRKKIVVRFLIANCAGRTALELTRAIYGEDAVFSRVDIECRRLVEEGLVRREGTGCRHDPYRYWPVESST